MINVTQEQKSTNAGNYECRREFEKLRFREKTAAKAERTIFILLSQ